MTLLPNVRTKNTTVIRPFYQGRRGFQHRTPLSGKILGQADNNDLFTHTEDYEYRKKFSYYRNSLFIDQNGGGPFRAHLNSTDDYAHLAYLTVWTELERFRTEFNAMEQMEIVREKEFIMKFFTDPQYYEIIPELIKLRSDVSAMRLEG